MKLFSFPKIEYTLYSVFASLTSVIITLRHITLKFCKKMGRWSFAHVQHHIFVYFRGRQTFGYCEIIKKNLIFASRSRNFNFFYCWPKNKLQALHVQGNRSVPTRTIPTRSNPRTAYRPRERDTGTSDIFDQIMQTNGCGRSLPSSITF